MKTLTQQDHNRELPFSEYQQEAIVGFCIYDQLFFKKCYDRIKPTWFTYDPRVATIYAQMCKFYEEYKRPPKTADELLGDPFFIEQPMADRLSYNKTIVNCMTSTKQFDLETLKKHLTGFIRNCLFKEALVSGATGIKVKGFGETYIKTKNRLEEIEKASFEDDLLAFSFKDPEAWLSEDMVDKSKIISTGSAKLDEALQGGLYPGDSTVILAATNTGKTTMMLTLARHAAYQGRDVLVITHEGKARSIRRQLLAAMVGVSKHKLIDMAQEGKLAVIKEASEYLDKHLTYVHYSKALGMYVEDIINEIKSRNDAKKIRDGKGYDLIIDDYPAKQKSRDLMSQREARHAELSYIYDQYNLLAGELGSHIVTAAQTNREGYKQNMNTDNNSYLDIDKIGESYGIGTNTPNMMSLNRSPKDKEKNMLHVMIIKSRDGATHQTFHTFTDYGCSLTHGDKKMFQRFNATDLVNVGLANSLQSDSSKLPDDTVLSILEDIKRAYHEEYKAKKASEGIIVP